LSNFSKFSKPYPLYLDLLSTTLTEETTHYNAATSDMDLTPTQVPYLDWDPNLGRGKTVFVESYGCQMNLSDTEIVYAIMEQSGYQKAAEPDAVRSFY
jgi:hypothetical protein